MIVIVNSHIPASAQQALSRYAEVVPFATEGITYPQLSGHADIFMYQPSGAAQLVVAPNLPPRYLECLRARAIPFSLGQTLVDASLSAVSAYNVASCAGLAIYNPQYIDASIQLGDSVNRVLVRQGMCRCAALVLDEHHVVTSDGGIAKALAAQGVSVLAVDASSIRLPGYRCGCFGGCCGLAQGRLFIVGALSYHPQGEAVRKFVAQVGYEVVELYDGPLFDAGSLFFI